MPWCYVIPPQPEDFGEPTSVLLPLLKIEASSDSQIQTSGVVEWKAPHIDWNPWTCCSAYQMSGPYHSMEPEARATHLSQQLYREMDHRKMKDPVFCKVCKIAVAATVFDFSPISLPFFEK